MANYNKEVSNLAKEATTNAELQNELMRWMKANQDKYLPELLDNSFNFMADTRDAPIITAMTDRSSMPNGLPTRTRFGGKRPEYVKHTEPPAKVEVEEDDRVQVATGIKPLDEDTKPIVDVIPPIDLSRFATSLPWQRISDVTELGADAVGNVLGWADDKTGNRVSGGVDYLKDKLGWQSPWDYTKDWEELLYGDRNVATDAVDNRIFYDNKGNEIAKNQDYLPDDRQQSETRMPWEQMPETLNWMQDTALDQFQTQMINTGAYDPFAGKTFEDTNPFDPQFMGDDPAYANWTPPTDVNNGPDLDIPIGARPEGLTMRDQLGAHRRRQQSLPGAEFIGLPKVIDEPPHLRKRRLGREQLEIEQGSAVPIGPDDVDFLLNMYRNSMDEDGNNVDEDGDYIKFISDDNGNITHLRDPKGTLRRWIDSLEGKVSGGWPETPRESSPFDDFFRAADDKLGSRRQDVASMDWQDEPRFSNQVVITSGLVGSLVMIFLTLLPLLMEGLGVQPVRTYLGLGTLVRSLRG